MVAYGNADWGRAGNPPLPVQKLKNYMSRFGLVVDTDEMRTSITCLCGERTEPLEIDVFDCQHVKKFHYIRPPDGIHRALHKRMKFCFANNRILDPSHQCPSRRMIHKSLIRHRVCPNCRLDIRHEVDFDEPWQLYLSRYDGVWHKDISAACQMRRILQSHIETGETFGWNRR